MNDIFHHHILPILLKRPPNKHEIPQYTQTILTLSTLSSNTSKTRRFQKEYAHVTHFFMQKTAANINPAKPTILVFMRRGAGKYIRSLPRDDVISLNTNTPMPQLPRAHKLPKIRQNVISRIMYHPLYNFLVIPLDYDMARKWTNRNEVRDVCRSIVDVGSVIVGVCYARDSVAPQLVEASSF